MPEPSLPANYPTPIPLWSENLIYAVLADPVRRQLLVTLARGGPRPAGDLKIGVRRRLDATLKRLISLRKSGLVVMLENPGDGRKNLYALAANVPVKLTEKGATLDFEFVTVRL